MKDEHRHEVLTAAGSSTSSASRNITYSPELASKPSQKAAIWPALVSLRTILISENSDSKVARTEELSSVDASSTMTHSMFG